MQFDPLSEIFPLVEGADFEELVQDIKRNGLEYPIVLYNGKILDGRNRYRACIEAGIEPEYITYEGDDPLGKVISLNMTRRHLTVGQRALIAARLANMKVGRPAAVLNPQICGVSQVDAATRMNVGQRTVEQAKRVMRLAPQLVPAIERGDLTLNAAFVQTHQRITPESHPTISVLSISTEMSTTARRIRKFLESNPDISDNSKEIVFDDATNLITALNELRQKYRSAKSNLKLVKEK